QQVVDMFVKVDKAMATKIADNIGVDRPSGEHVPVSESSPAVSQAYTNRFPYSLKVGVLIGNGFHGKEVRYVLDTLQQYGVFIVFVGESLGTVTGDDGTQIEIDETFTTTDSTLLDALYVVGGSAEDEQKFQQNILSFIRDAYNHYKPIGVATTGQNYWQVSDMNALPGVVFAANNPDFGDEFIAAIAQQRFWNRKV